MCKKLIGECMGEGCMDVLYIILASLLCLKLFQTKVIKNKKKV